MAAPIDRTGNFKNNFCSKFLDYKELVLFNTDECRIRKRDRFNSVFQSAVLETSERQQKFKTLWALREQNWSSLSEDERKNCDKNLESLAKDLFAQKKTEEEDRKKTVNFYGFRIEGMNQPLLNSLLESIKESLIRYGRVGVARNGTIVEHDRLNDRDAVLEFRYSPNPRGGPGDLVVLVPHDWTITNSEGTRHVPQGSKEPQPFTGGPNRFRSDLNFQFTIRVSAEVPRRGLPDAAQMSRFSPAPRELTMPLSSSSSSSSSAAKGSFISEYDALMDHHEPVPPEFLVTLTSGQHEAYFHCYSLTAAMLSLATPQNPLTMVDVPSETLREMAQKMHVDPLRFMGIWEAAEKAFPERSQHEARRERRYELFRAMINSDEGSAAERSARRKTRSQMAERSDWQLLLKKTR